MKTIVVYYSHGGKTKAVAQGVALEFQCGTEEIRLKKVQGKKPGAVDMMQKRKKGQLPAIYHESLNLNKQQTIILGGPIWGGTVAAPIYSLINHIDWKNKTVAVFVTAALFGTSKALAKLKKELESRGATVNDQKAFFSLLRNPKTLKTAGAHWAKDLKKQATDKH